MSFFDLMPIKRRNPTRAMFQEGHCVDCGRKAELTAQRCPKCDTEWLRQSVAANRALNRG